MSEFVPAITADMRKATWYISPEPNETQVFRAMTAHPDFQRQLRAYVAEQMRGLVPEADDPNEYDGDWRLNDLKRMAEAEVDFRNETLANIAKWESSNG